MNIDFSSAFGARVQEQLLNEQVCWLTTVGASDTPQPNLVWFLYQDEAVLMYTKPDAIRLKNIVRNNRVAINFNSDEDGHAMTVITGTATVDETVPPAIENSAYLEKYADGIKAIGLTPESFAREYSVPIRIEIRKVRGW